MPSETAVRRQGDPMARLRRVIGEPATRVEPPRPDSWERSASVTMFVAEVPDGIRPILRALIEGGTQPGLADHGGGRAVRSHARETMLRHLRELAASGR